MTHAVRALRADVSRTAAACLLALALAAAPARADEVIEGFGRGVLDHHLWNTCQAEPDLLDFGIDGTTGRDYLIIRIDGQHEDTGPCVEVAERGLDGDRESLSPSFFVDTTVAATLGRTNCPRPEKRDGMPIIQRNELRFARPDLSPPVTVDTWYSLTFRLRGYDGDSLPDCGSARWVIGQWKYRLSVPGSDPSPFLAQRFDNGVLHLTMEDDGCRCMIAKTGGDPDFSGATEADELRPTPPLKCRYSQGPKSNDRCTPARLRLAATDLATLSTLPDPKQGWVRMTYRIRAAGPQGVRIDVYANGRFIVRAEGDIAPLIAGNRVKFKIGHYRDKIPIKAEMLVDEVCVSETAATCDRTVTPLP